LQENEQIAQFYTALPNTSIYKDERNCLVIKNSKISDHIIFTNDIVELISDRQFEWLGRFDNVINSGGIKLHPEKIEEKLAEIMEYRFFVTGIANEILGEKLILILECSAIVLSKIKDSLYSKIKHLKTISRFEVPKEIYGIEQFKETGAKKIQRKKTLDLIDFSE
jgi:O-succinylbenzoic acid--CoA ligase